jgi:hypothetical protein
MKLAEALVERKAAQEKIRELSGRLQRVAVIQEGEKPAEKPQRQGVLDTLLNATGNPQYRMRGTEIKFVTTTNIAKLQREGGNGENLFAKKVTLCFLKTKLLKTSALKAVIRCNAVRN